MIYQTSYSTLYGRNDVKSIIPAHCQVGWNREPSISMLHTAQIKAARSLLGWRQQDLSRAADVGLATIQRIEKSDGPVGGNYTTVLRIQSALEAAGIQFTDDETAGIGVRLLKKPPKAPGKRR